MITFVYGPPACGKTRHRQQFAEMYAADRILDGWTATTGAIPMKGDLVLTCDSPEQIHRFCDANGITRYRWYSAVKRIPEAKAVNVTLDRPLSDPTRTGQRSDKRARELYRRRHDA